MNTSKGNRNFEMGREGRSGRAKAGAKPSLPSFDEIVGVEQRKVVAVYNRRPKKSASSLSEDESGNVEERQLPNEYENKPWAAKLLHRKSWIDRSLSSKGRRISLVFDFESQRTNKKKYVAAPESYIRQQKAHFAEVDAYDLQEESPSPKPSGFHSRLTEDMACLLPACNAPLQAVPEDSSGEVTQTPEGLSTLLSAALNTPWGHASTRTSSHIDDLVHMQRSLILNEVNDFTDLKQAVIETEVEPQAVATQPEDTVELVQAYQDGVKETLSNSSLVKSITSQLEALEIHEDQKGDSAIGRLVVEEEIEDDILKDELRDTFNSPGATESKFFETTESVPIFSAILHEAQQEILASLTEVLCEFCDDITTIAKVGEGTYGEAFKGSGNVFKIVPMDGDFRVNGEIQKTLGEMYTEILLTNTLNRLRSTSQKLNTCKNFIETKAIRICQGTYDGNLIRTWEEWDTQHGSENDHPMLFPEKQLYVVFVLADGGADLESCVLADFNEARSLLLQVALSLAVAEEACAFEHRDLHWGNVLLSRKQDEILSYTLLGKRIDVKSSGVLVSLIDFTLSRVDTGKQALFCDLSADPALFEGPEKDIQAETYRRMLKLTNGRWEKSFPKTNCLWIHYLTEILLKKKAFRCSQKDKRLLRDFSQRAMLYDSAKAAFSDAIFEGLWEET